MSGLRMLLPLILLGLAAAGASSTNSSGAAVAGDCPLPALQELLLPVLDQCPRSTPYSFPGVYSASRVMELTEGPLEQMLNQVRSNNDTFMAVLYYASWCPFSKQLLPVFETMSVLFPFVPHGEIEESSIRPGLLSKFGVYSFPVLYIYGGSSRSRYSGPRTIEDLTRFYVNTTRIQPKKLATKPNLNSAPRTAEPALSQRLQNDSLLALASWFLVLRILWLVLPVAVHRVRNFWDRCHLYKMLMPRNQNETQAAGDRRALKSRPKRKRRLPGWSHQIAAPASSLAIAESSARRIGSGEDLR